MELPTEWLNIDLSTPNLEMSSTTLTSSLVQDQKQEQEQEQQDQMKAKLRVEDIASRLAYDVNLDSNKMAETMSSSSRDCHPQLEVGIPVQDMGSKDPIIQEPAQTPGNEIGPFLM